MSILPLETPLGRKRAIDQSSCNKDYSCVKGFCPSFVTVEGGALRKPAKTKAANPEGLPSPQLPALDEPRPHRSDGVARAVLRPAARGSTR